MYNHTEIDCGDDNDTVFVKSTIKDNINFIAVNLGDRSKIVMRTIFDQLENEINLFSPKDLEWETKLKVKFPWYDV